MTNEEQVILVMSLLYNNDILPFFNDNKYVKILKVKEEFLKLDIKDKNKYLELEFKRLLNIKKMLKNYDRKQLLIKIKKEQKYIKKILFEIHKKQTNKQDLSPQEELVLNIFYN
jgi:hypothetical protein